MKYMKDKKRILALLAVGILVIVCLLPMIFAFRKGENSQGEFMAVVGIAIFVPVFAYICMIVYRVLKGRNPQVREGIRNVIFDVGNVLMDFDWPSYLKSFCFEEEKENRLADVIFKSRTWQERDRGGKSEEEYIEAMVAEAPEYESDIREIMRRSYECIHPVEYSLTWVRFLKEQGCSLYVLSNYCQYMLDVNRKDMAFLPYMDGVVFSCEVNMLKPETAIYKKLLDEYRLVPSECVFIDDRKENCSSAEALGMKTICFENFPQAAKELENMLKS